MRGFLGFSFLGKCNGVQGVNPRGSVYTGQTHCGSFVGKGHPGLERVARYPSTYLLYVVDIEIYLSCSILEGIRDPGTESTLDHIMQ